MSESRLSKHPYAELFPPMTSAEFDIMCGSILLRGLDEPIVMYEGKILGGWHRYLACLAKRVPPRFREYAGECGSPLAFVVDKNLNRRHMTEGQGAVLGAKLRVLFEEEAQLRQRAGLKKGSEIPVRENSPSRGEHEKNDTSAQKAAQLMKVSDFSVRAADKVQKQGVPELVDALAAGKISVSAAAHIAKLPVEQQQAVVAGIASGLKPKQALAQVQEKFTPTGNSPVDDDGRPLPEGVLPAFRQREEFRTLCRRIEAISRAVERLSTTPAGVHLDVQRGLDLSRGRPPRPVDRPTGARMLTQSGRGRRLRPLPRTWLAARTRRGVRARQEGSGWGRGTDLAPRPSSVRLSPSTLSCHLY